jgi:Ser/Thr protein kinase RdoA (MazF antagonist)
MQHQLHHVLEGYTQFCDFDSRELHLVEALRTLRMIHHSGWLARRWHDPAFPASFPWFGTPRYWEEQVLAMREQAALLDEAPLAIE